MSKDYSTLAVHAGEDHRKPYGALTTPIVQTSTYTFADTAEIQEFVRRKESGAPKRREEYGRYGNPTQSTVERKLAALEGGERALLFASGMNAITTTLLSLLSAGDHLVVVDGCYRRTRQFADEFLRRWGITTSLVPIDDFDALAAALRPDTRAIFTETPTNPYLRIMDLARLAEIARAHNVLTLIDSTFATPLNLRPLDLGLDLVIHSATKYLGGHNDLLAGVVIGRAALLEEVEESRAVLGGVGNPLQAYLLLRGLKTLALRVQRQNENGERVADFLADHPAVARVFYPGLPSHPDHAVARRQMSGFGGVVSFEVRGGLRRTAQFMDRLQLPYIGPTLGGVESIAQQQALFISTDPQERRKLGIADNLVRYALGVEAAEDIIADLEQALAGS
jgi:cystathionine gamma-synthase